MLTISIYFFKYRGKKVVCEQLFSGPLTAAKCKICDAIKENESEVSQIQF